MCRWMAYRGRPVPIETLLYKTQHSLIEQSRHARLGVETFNGDGFGVGWYDDGDGPGRYRSLMPAWGDHNLRDLSAHIRSPLFLAHVRATTGTPVQDTNCHPFRHENWLFVHNGAIDRFHEIRRELVLAVDPAFYDAIEGSTDSETMFALALTFGLMDDDPIGALERMAGFVEETGRAHGIEHPLQMSLGVSDGERLYAVRYSTIGDSRTLFHSADAQTLRELYPDHELVHDIGDEDRAIVSEPLGDLPGVWEEIPEATALIVQDGPDEQRAFRPRALAGAA